ncbi:hypothetical protein FN846DRAFT_440986 [Sphaerosporella brunnea]|uniref:STEEP1 domain-containing protein n=1 Tax=Sphaerosporella brunnea TaxID=1250544 RepID=A0A5J5F4R5_9PEZI|nr:hypothetical protein FN846DRAFT_440986 [Sphaerosporella brunnea]
MSRMTTPHVHTYHCTFCSHLLLASTHIISALPTRRAPGLDNATIVPLQENTESDSDREYTLLLTLTRDRAAKVVAREDGFEKRVLWRCGRCKLIVGYMLDEEKRRGCLYLLPGAVVESSELGQGEPEGQAA